MKIEIGFEFDKAKPLGRFCLDENKVYLNLADGHVELEENCEDEVALKYLAAMVFYQWLMTSEYEAERFLASKIEFWGECEVHIRPSDFDYLSFAVRELHRPTNILWAEATEIREANAFDLS